MSSVPLGNSDQPDTPRRTSKVKRHSACGQGDFCGLSLIWSQSTATVSSNHVVLGQRLVFDRFEMTKRDAFFCVVLILAFFAYTLSDLWGNWATDFSAYYYAGHFWGTGQLDQIYAGTEQVIGPQMPLEWTFAVVEDGYAGEQTYPFIYPPWVAVLMTPFTNMDPMILMNGVLVLNCSLMIASMWLAYRFMQPHTVSPVIWTLYSVLLFAISFTSTIALYLGQIQILVFFCCMLAFERLRYGAHWSAGMALAVAACLKVTPGALILIFIWNRNWRALGGFIVVSAAILAFSYGYMGVTIHAEFLTTLHKLEEQLFIAGMGFSVEGFIFDLVHTIKGTGIVHNSGEMIFEKPDWVGYFAKGLFVFGAAAIWWRTRGMYQPRALQRQFVGLALLIPLAAPLGWAHYFLLATYVLPAFGVLFGQRAFNVIYLTYLFLFSMIAQMLMARVGLTFFPQIMISVPILLGILGLVIVAPARPREPAQQTQNIGAIPAE
jgi:hypothetical protein